MSRVAMTRPLLVPLSAVKVTGMEGSGYNPAVTTEVRVAAVLIVHRLLGHRLAVAVTRHILPFFVP